MLCLTLFAFTIGLAAANGPCSSTVQCSNGPQTNQAAINSLLHNILQIQGDLFIKGSGSATEQAVSNDGTVQAWLSVTNQGDTSSSIDLICAQTLYTAIADECGNFGGALCSSECAENDTTDGFLQASIVVPR
ncbi:hypothetical protein OIDMADRAFT_46869 [Oidiodendron maius Zn]|uniref:Uncharacterized protein n=1 Tax=Oidiodendron maius (strain Zn) TaxID=913774 RepID=A0A0C3HXK6_OIDMZ|nr:hypothetical protein OIDMADRAFT_46869 [Oidiodendron maius Zn]